jgi:hypothetical protein
VEGGVGISEALLAGAKSTEVLGSLWDYIIVEVEVDATGLICDKVLKDVIAGQ